MVMLVVRRLEFTYALIYLYMIICSSKLGKCSCSDRHLFAD